MRISDWSSDVCSSDLLNDRFVELQGILPRGLLLDESTDAADDLGRTPSVLDGTTKRLPDLVQIWRLGTQPAQGRLGIGDSRPERLHDLMRNRGCQLSHGGDPLNMGKIRPRLTQGLRGALTLGHGCEPGGKVGELDTGDPQRKGEPRA